MSDDEAIKALIATTETFKKSTILEMYGPQAALLMLMYKLGMIGARRVWHSHYGMLTNSSGFKYTPPPCSIKLATVSLYLDYIQFCPKRMADKDLKF